MYKCECGEKFDLEDYDCYEVSTVSVDDVVINYEFTCVNCNRFMVKVASYNLDLVCDL